MCVWVRRAFLCLFWAVVATLGVTAAQYETAAVWAREVAALVCSAVTFLSVFDPMLHDGSGLKKTKKMSARSKMVTWNDFSSCFIVCFFCTNNFTKLRNRCRHH